MSPNPLRFSLAGFALISLLVGMHGWGFEAANIWFYFCGLLGLSYVISLEPSD